MKYAVVCAVCDNGFIAKARRARVCRHCHKFVYRVRYRAIAKVWKMIYQGALPPASELACVDCGGSQASRCQMVYDHRHYSRPRKVVPVCGSCNVKRGAAKDLYRLARQLRIAHMR